MNRTFQEKAIDKAVKASKKNKILTPLIYIVLTMILGGYYVYWHILNNGRRYIVLGMAVVFFFMSTSFSFPDANEDSAIYLENADTVENLSDNVVADDSELNENDVTVNVAWIEDSELISEELQDQLSNTDNLDKFTLDDFLKEAEISVANAKNEESAFDKNAWNLILVNKTHPVPDDYDVPLTTISGSMKCDERVLEPLTEMLAGAQKDKISLIVCSPYRDYTLQTTLFNRKVSTYMARGYSYMDAYRMTCSNVTVPGASEHQIGMAFDIVTEGHTVLDYEFGNTPAGKWLYEHCHEYGFILRYPSDKTDITGIMYEPWHFRYVGVEAATYIMENNITLEEFIDGL